MGALILLKASVWLVLMVGSGIAVCDRAVAAVQKKRDTDLVWLIPVAWLVHAGLIVLYPL